MGQGGAGAEYGEPRRDPFERKPSDPRLGAVVWDRHGERSIGVFLPSGHLALLRGHVARLLDLTTDRLDQHAGGALERIDPRLDSVLWTRRMAHSTPQLPELDMLIPMANRYRSVLDTLPADGAVCVLPDAATRNAVGLTALEICIVLDAWLRAWIYGDPVDGVPRPTGELLEVLADCRDWTAEQIEQPLRPVADGTSE